MSVGISLEGRVALVTGGASGIGRAAAVRLAEAGARVAVVDLDEAGDRETVERLHQVGGEAALIVGASAWIVMSRVPSTELWNDLGA